MADHRRWRRVLGAVRLRTIQTSRGRVCRRGAPARPRLPACLRGRRRFPLAGGHGFRGGAVRLRPRWRPGCLSRQRRVGACRRQPPVPPTPGRHLRRCHRRIGSRRRRLRHGSGPRRHRQRRRHRRAGHQLRCQPAVSEQRRRNLLEHLVDCRHRGFALVHVGGVLRHRRRRSPGSLRRELRHQRTALRVRERHRQAGLLRPERLPWRLRPLVPQ